MLQLRGDYDLRVGLETGSERSLLVPRTCQPYLGGNEAEIEIGL